jgi:hypothetical protein
VTFDLLGGNFRKYLGRLREFSIVNEEVSVEVDSGRDICPTAIYR